MHRRTVLLTCVLGFIGMLFVATDANATVALCVGCTANSQFEGAAWQATGTSFIGDKTVLVVNPDSGMSRWVRLTHYPPGVKQRDVPAGRTQNIAVQPGTAVPVDSNPFAAIYIAGTSLPHVDAGGGISSARATPVSTTDQAAINTAIAVTKKTWFVQLNPSEFPSYEGSMAIAIAKANYAAMSAAGVGWPVSDESDGWLDDLLKTLGSYTGHSFMVCDAFGNGDSVCVVPDPYSDVVYNQTGPAKDANGNKLPDIGQRVAGGGGGGMGVTRSPGHINYSVPGSTNVGDVVCGYVDNVLSICILKY